MPPGLDGVRVARPHPLRRVVAWVGWLPVVVWLVWALLPGALVLGLTFTHLPGERLVIGFALLFGGMPWACFGIGLFMTGLIERARRGWMSALAGVAVALAVAVYQAALALPWEWSVAPLARARFAATAVDGRWMAVPGDSYFSGCGYFVQESGGEGADGLAVLEFADHRLAVQRGRCAGVEPNDTLRADWALVVPLRDGWCYVYLDY